MTQLADELLSTALRGTFGMNIAKRFAQQDFSGRSKNFSYNRASRDKNRQR